jgi:hypothetical protein
MRLPLVVIALAFAFIGCKSNCRQLSEKLCDCAANTNDKTLCLQSVSTREQNNPPTAANEAACQPLIATCDCRLIDTPQGKANCGLARPLAEGN